MNSIGYHIRELASIYIQHGLVVKNRFGDTGIKADNNFTKWLSMSNDNLIIETNGGINVYCTKDKEDIYRRKIKFATHNFNIDADTEVNIYLVNEHSLVNNELIKILYKCNDCGITVLRVSVDNRELVGEDIEGKVTTFSFDEFDEMK